MKSLLRLELTAQSRNEILDYHILIEPPNSIAMIIPPKQNSLLKQNNIVQWSQE